MNLCQTPVIKICEWGPWATKAEDMIWYRMYRYKYVTYMAVTEPLYVRFSYISGS